MSRALLCLVCLVLAGCAGQGGVELVVSSSGVVRAVDELTIAVDNAGQGSQPTRFPLAPAADISAANPVILNLSFAADRQGPVTLHVVARAGGATVASADGTADLHPGELAHVTVLLPGGGGDMGGGDMSGGDGGTGDDGGRPDLGTLPSTWNVVGWPTGIGSGVASGTGLSLEGVFSTPGPRVTATGNGFSVEPLIPGR